MLAHTDLGAAAPVQSAVSIDREIRSIENTMRTARLTPTASRRMRLRLDVLRRMRARTASTSPIAMPRRPASSSAASALRRTQDRARVASTLRRQTAARMKAARKAERRRKRSAGKASRQALRNRITARARATATPLGPALFPGMPSVSLPRPGFSPPAPIRRSLGLADYALKATPIALSEMRRGRRRRRAARIAVRRVGVPFFKRNQVVRLVLARLPFRRRRFGPIRPYMTPSATPAERYAPDAIFGQQYKSGAFQFAPNFMPLPGAAAPAAASETDAELDAELDAMDTPLYKRPLVLAAGAAGAYLLWTNRKKIKAESEG